MTDRRLRAHRMARVRAYVAITLIALWAASALTGFLLYVAPTGPRSGRAILVLSMTNHEWGELHFWAVDVSHGVVPGSLTLVPTGTVRTISAAEPTRVLAVQVP